MKDKRAIGEICVSVTGTSAEEIVNEAELVNETEADIVEWRADYYHSIADCNTVSEMTACLKDRTGGQKLLFTLRSSEEGGRFTENSSGEYRRICMEAIDSGAVDMIDIEYSAGKEIAEDLIREARKCGVSVILSFHEMTKTPNDRMLLRRIRKMEKMLERSGGETDIIKICVMPRSREDVRRIIRLQLKYNCPHKEGYEKSVGRKKCRIPAVIISMSEKGKITRISGIYSGTPVIYCRSRKNRQQICSKETDPTGQMSLDFMKTILGNR